MVLTTATVLTGCVELRPRSGPTELPPRILTPTRSQPLVEQTTPVVKVVTLTPHNSPTTVSLLSLSPTPAPPTVTVTSTPTPTNTLTPTPSGEQYRERFNQAVAKLDQAGSFRFTVEEQHKVNVAGSAMVFAYTGQGAYGGKDRFVSVMQGATDVLFYVEMDGENRACFDNRGPIKECTPFLGGPRRGASPYALIEYLRQVEAVELRPPASAQAKVMTLRFRPSISRIAAISSEHTKALDQVVAVEGELTVDTATGLPTSQSVEVVLRTPGGEERVTATMQFGSYGDPFNPKIFRPHDGD